jgi:hypothetical protein
MTDNSTSKATSRQPGADADVTQRRAYEPPSLVDYGDIATVTQTAKGSKPDGLNKKFRTG